MGVDYSAVFGIGIKIDTNEIETIYKNTTGNEPDEDTSTDELLDCCELPEGISYGEYGSYNYGGKRNFVLLIKNPFENGTGGVEEKIKKFEKQLNEIGLVDFKIDLVGGLHIW